MPKTDLGFIEALVKDGRPLLTLTGLALIFSGGFALFVSASQQFLPHDIHFLKTDVAALGSLAEGRVANFMFHDRVAFGGSLIAIGLLYLWLVEFPLAKGQLWAWRAFLVSGALGFTSFLTYLGYGYLDSWHGAGTLALLPLFTIGLFKSRALIAFSPSGEPRPTLASWGPRAKVGRILLLATGAGMVLAGGTIMVMGMTTVFVPQDLTYLGVSVEDLTNFNPRLVPLIAHDRAGFGGGIASCGVLVMFCVWFGRPSRSLWQVLALSGLFGFGTAIGVHFFIGYTDFVHLAPAYVGLSIYLVGWTAAVLGTGRGSN